MNIRTLVLVHLLASTSWDICLFGLCLGALDLSEVQIVFRLYCYIIWAFDFKLLNPVLFEVGYRFFLAFVIE